MMDVKAIKPFAYVWYTPEGGGTWGPCYGQEKPPASAHMVSALYSEEQLLDALEAAQAENERLKEEIECLNAEMSIKDASIHVKKARIKELEAKQRWVPITLNSPANDQVKIGEYIICMSDVEIPVIFEWPVKFCLINTGYTRWMPLPQPPEQESE